MALIAWTSSYLTGQNYAAGDQTRVEACINAAQAGMESYCHRLFESAERTKIFRINADAKIFLDAYPATNVLRCITSKVDALSITSTAPVAGWSVTSTGLSLYKIASGTRTDTTLLFATYTTIADLAAAMPSGFSATVLGSLGAYPSIDLAQGASGSTPSSVPMWQDTGSHWTVDNNAGIVYLSGYYDWRQTWLNGGYNYYPDYMPLYAKVTYTGGYTTVPYDLQEVCSVLTASIFNDLGFSKLSPPAGDAYVNRLPMERKHVLNRYRNRIA